MKKIFSLLGLLMLVCNSSFAAGYSRTLNDQIQVAGYKNAVLYDFQNNSPEVLPTSGDLRYRAFEKGGYWGLHNFGGGGRSATISLAVKENQLIILQPYAAGNITAVGNATFNEAASAASGYSCYSVAADADNFTISVAKGGGVVAMVVMDKDNSVATADYTINYTFNEGVVKTVSGSLAVGAKVIADSNFKVDNQKYFIVDGSQTEFEIASSGNTFNVPVRLANNYSYTVNAVFGTTVLKILATGSAIEGETTKVPYPIYIENGGKLYTKGATNKEYNYGFTLNEPGTVNIEYSATDINNVVYYTEGEDIPGTTFVSSGNAGVRSSQSAVGYAATDDLELITLPAGVYTLTGVGFIPASAGGTITINANPAVLGNESNAVLTISGKSSNWTTATAQNVVISEPTALTLAKGGSDNVGLDFFYAQKTADYVASESIAIGEAELEIGKSAVMTATITPANASRQKLTWSIVEGGMAAKGLNMVAEEDGEAEIDAETGALTPKKAGRIWVKVSNGEVDDYKSFYINPAVFAVTITDAPSEAFVYVGGENGDQSEGETIKVTTKAGYDDMQNTTRLQPKGSVTATEIPTYIYSIAVDKSKKTIDVTYERDIEVTAMEFSPAEQRIAMGNSRTLKVTYYPANASFKSATWESSNPDVATIDPVTGFVTTKSEGTTTITAKWSENESHGTDYSAELTLTVDKGLVLDNIVYDEMEDGTAEVMGYYFPLPGDTLYLPSQIDSNGRMIPVSFIDQEAFIGCNLKSIIIPGTVKTIDHRALEYSNTHNAYNEGAPEDGLESAFLLEGVEVMRDRIFFGNKYMKKVFLPSTLKEIGYYSFDETAIEDVYYGGTEKQWKELDSLTNARYGEGAISFSKLPATAQIHFNSTFIGAMLSGVSVEEDFVKLDAGEEYQIEVTVAPEQIADQVELTFTSSDEEIATVDEDGVITAVADGLATITVSAGGQEATVKVQVGDVRDYTTPLVTTWSVQGGSNPVKGVFTDEETHYYNNWGNLEAGWFAQAYAQFDLSNLLPTDDFKATFTVWVNCARGTRTFDVYGLPAGSKKEDYQELTAKKGVELATYSDIVTDYQAKEIDVTEYIKGILAEGGSDAIIIMSNGAAGGNIYGKGSAEFAPTLNIYPANGDDSQLTGISEAQAEETVKSGKYFEKGQVVIYINGKKYNAAGQQVK